MDNRLSTKDFLRVFDSIRSTGTKQDHKYQLGALEAWHDYDGYTCWLGFRDVTVTLMFHGSLKVEYDSATNYNEFIERCLALNNRKTVH